MCSCLPRPLAGDFDDKEHGMELTIDRLTKREKTLFIFSDDIFFMGLPAVIHAELAEPPSTILKLQDRVFKQR